MSALIVGLVICKRFGGSDDDDDVDDDDDDKV